MVFLLKLLTILKTFFSNCPTITNDNYSINSLGSHGSERLASKAYYVHSCQKSRLRSLYAIRAEMLDAHCNVTSKYLEYHESERHTYLRQLCRCIV